MAIKIGLDCKLYFNATPLTDETYTGITTELTNVRDLTLNVEKGEADISTRGNNGWRQYAGTLKDGSIEFDMMWDPEDAGFTAIKNAFFNDTQIAIAALDGAHDENGSSGLAGNFEVINFTRSEPLEEGATVSVTLRPAGYNNWYTVGGT